jgi:hypothetical protein
MWVEAIVSQEDFVALAAELLPLSVHLGDPDSDHYLLLSAATAVSLVEGRGLRVTCDAQIRWPVLGMDIPINVEGLTVLVEPSVPEAKGPLLVGVQLEHADVAWLPAIIDAKIVDAINDALKKKSADLSWTFTRTLSHEFELPEILQPLSGLDLSAGWGKVRVTTEAMVLVVSFHVLAVKQDADGRARRAERTLARAHEHAVVRASEPPAPIAVVSTKTAAIATALVLTTAYVMLRGVFSLFAGGPRLRRPRAAW